MTQLRTTPKGSLKKYIPEIVSIINHAMDTGQSIACGPQKNDVKKINYNQTIIKRFQRFASSPDKEKDALALVLKRKDGLYFSIGAIDKPNEKGNQGDIGERYYGCCYYCSLY